MFGDSRILTHYVFYKRLRFKKKKNRIFETLSVLFIPVLKTASHIEQLHYCVIIPTYNNCKTLKQVIDGVLEYTENVIVVNDGSTDNTDKILKNYGEIQIVNLKKNLGKGAALKQGFTEAIKQGFTYAITIDSDGQHFPNDIPVFVEEVLKNGEALLIGSRNMEQEGVPKKSSFGNRFSNFWFWVETGIKLKDTQSGYRLYPLSKINKLSLSTTKFEFEIEVIVKAAWSGVRVKNVPVKVLYDENERVSHFRPFKDFTRISILNTWLVLVAFIYIKPRDYIRLFKKKGVKRFFLEDLLQSSDPIEKKSMSVALGIFFGIAPFWGFQTVLVLFFAQLLKLNKFISFAFSNISLPPLIPLIVYASLKTGSIFIGKGEIPVFAWETFKTLDGFKENMIQYIVGSLVLAFIMAILFYGFTWTLLRFNKKKISAY